MRSRSGAIHCESEDDYITLAEATHNATAVFYDEHSHQALRQRLAHTPRILSTQRYSSLPESPSFSQCSFPVAFSDFDFAAEDQFLMEQRGQMERGKIEGVQVHVGIVSSSSFDALSWLWECVGVAGWQVEQGRALQLVVESNGYGVYKYWVLASTQSKYGQVIDLYVNDPPLLIRLNHHQRTYSTLRGDIEAIKDSSVGLALSRDWQLQP